MASPRSLSAVLAEARELGYLGPGDPTVHLAHARQFAVVIANALDGPPSRFADLGTGGGVPGLVLAGEWQDSVGALIESSTRRAASLRRWVEELGMGARVQVLGVRAEDVAHDPGMRETFDVVTARSFAPPPAVAEVAIGLLRLGGLLVVSEPPGGDRRRWPDDELQQIGLGSAQMARADEASFALVRKVAAAPQRLPRQRGRAFKHPRW